MRPPRNSAPSRLLRCPTEYTIVVEGESVLAIWRRFAAPSVAWRHDPHDRCRVAEGVIDQGASRGPGHPVPSLHHQGSFVAVRPRRDSRRYRIGASPARFSPGAAGIGSSSFSRTPVTSPWSLM